MARPLQTFNSINSQIRTKTDGKYLGSGVGKSGHRGKNGIDAMEITMLTVSAMEAKIGLRLKRIELVGLK